MTRRKSEPGALDGELMDARTRRNSASGDLDGDVTNEGNDLMNEVTRRSSGSRMSAATADSEMTPRNSAETSAPTGGTPQRHTALDSGSTRRNSAETSVLMDGVIQRSCANGAYDVTDEPTRYRVDGAQVDGPASGAAAVSDRMETDLMNNLPDLGASKKNRHVVNHDVKVCVLTFTTRERRMKLRNSLVQRSSCLSSNVIVSWIWSQAGWKPAPGKRQTSTRR